MKINIVRRPETLDAELYLYEVSEDRRVFTTFNINEKGEVVAHQKERKSGEALESKPFMILREDEMRNFIKVIVEYANDEGFKNADESFAKGKLESQSEHLKDLRKLLKL